MTPLVAARVKLNALAFWYRVAPPRFYLGSPLMMSLGLVTGGTS
jgi:hypothetical protein